MIARLSKITLHAKIIRRFELMGCDIPTVEQIETMISIQESFYVLGIKGNIDIVDLVINLQVEQDGKVRRYFVKQKEG